MHARNAFGLIEFRRAPDRRDDHLVALLAGRHADHAARAVLAAATALFGDGSLVTSDDLAAHVLADIVGLVARPDEHDVLGDAVRPGRKSERDADRRNFVAVAGCMDRERRARG